MTRKAKHIPEGSQTLTPNLSVRDMDKAIEFYKKAFGAAEVVRMPGPDGKPMHACLQVGDSRFMLGPECADMKDHPVRSPETLRGSSFVGYLYVEDADAAFGKAVKAGGKALMPVADMFWGDRCGQLQDPSGHVWFIATHTEDLTPAEIAKRRDAFFASAKP